jgi:RHS repeat-associated protein
MHVSPSRLTLPLDGSAPFSAAVYNSKGQAVNTGPVSWSAKNVKERSPARISPHGTFAARLPGDYKIIAKSGKYKGHAVVHIPDGITHDPNATAQCTTVSTGSNVQPSAANCPAGTPPLLPQPAITGPGWQDSNFRNAFLIENLRGHGVRQSRLSADRRGVNVDDGAGTGNYLLSIPLLDLPGRGQNLSLALFYNSQVWTKLQDPVNSKQWDMVFDHDHGWPAPGWSLGFGKVIRVGSVGVALEDPDGTIHPFAGQVATYTDDYTYFLSTTSDGTLIRCNFELQNGLFVTGFASYPNGTIVEFGALGADANAIYPTRIIDPNGNFVTISYLNGIGPNIDSIKDTLNRAINFNYDTDSRLISITAPGIGGGWRTVVRLHYRDQALAHRFADDLKVVNVPPDFWALEAIYSPGTHNGYWFGDHDSYSPYGMIAKISQRHGMSFDASQGDQGVVSGLGEITDEKTYDYPSGPDSPLTDAPTYSQMEEVWAPDRLKSPVVTHYVVRTEDGMPNPCGPIASKVSWRRLETTYPDSTLVVQRTLIDGGYDYGAVNQEQTYDGSNHLLRTLTMCYEQGDDQSPRITKMQTTDELNQTTTTMFTYQAKDQDHPSPENQLVDRRELDYDGTTVLRHTRVEYLDGWNYDASVAFWDLELLERRVVNLPSAVSIYQGEGQLVSRTEYQYDSVGGPPLSNTTGVINHDDAYNPYSAKYLVPAVTVEQCKAPPDNLSSKNRPGCSTVVDPAYWRTDYQAKLDYRGNVTQVKRYVNASDRTHPIIDTMYYDMDGNQVFQHPACCEVSEVTYTGQTQYAYPTAVRRGAPPDPTKTLTTQSAYDFNTGLLTATLDANNLVTKFYYDFDSLRPSKVQLPSGATTVYSYNDSRLNNSKTLLSADGGVASKSSITVNGLGKVEQVRALAPAGQCNVTAFQYDSLGRVSKTSQPFNSNAGSNNCDSSVDISKTQLWNVITFDSLGRVMTTSAADCGAANSTTCNRTSLFYDEVTRPSSASKLPGHVVRAQDATGRERWSRSDALGNLVEVVEPSAYGSNGSVSAPGDVATSYSYNALGQLTQSLQGADRQERDFAYDSLGRLAKQYLAENSRTLNDSGQYVGSSGSWSDVFTYDDRSNLVLQTDARGITTRYDYQDDPLSRLQILSYDTTGFGDVSNPVVQAPTVLFSYALDGDVTRVAQIEMANWDITDPASHRVSGAPTRDLQPWVQVNYTYDSQARIATKSLTYPLQKLPPLALDYQYDSLSRLVGLTYPAQYGTHTAGRKQVAYSYDVGNLTNLSIDGIKRASGLAYNAAGQLTSLKIGPADDLQTSETFDYEPSTTLLKEQWVRRGTAKPLLDLSYAYYSNGQVQRVSNFTPGERLNTSYQYDGLGRLLSVETSNEALALWSESYALDSYGNRLSAAAGGRTEDGTPIPLDGIAGSPVSPNGLNSLSYDTKTNHVLTAGFAYDAAGNQTRVQRFDGSWLRYQYDAAGRLAQVADDNWNTLESYQYGPDRRRLVITGSTSGTPPTYYVWDENRILGEYIQASQSTLEWSKCTTYLGNRILASFTPRDSKEFVQYHHLDNMGTRLITNGSDSTKIEQQTLPFGTILLGASMDPVNPVFATYNRSFVTGLDNAINREFGPGERFTQPDPLGISAASTAAPQSLNMYMYAGNDPVNNTDPTGLKDFNPCAPLDPDTCDHYSKPRYDNPLQGDPGLMLWLFEGQMNGLVTAPDSGTSHADQRAASQAELDWLNCQESGGCANYMPKSWAPKSFGLDYGTPPSLDSTPPPAGFSWDDINDLVRSGVVDDNTAANMMGGRLGDMRVPDTMPAEAQAGDDPISWVLTILTTAYAKVEVGGVIYLLGDIPADMVFTGSVGMSPFLAGAGGVYAAGKLGYLIGTEIDSAITRVVGKSLGDVIYDNMNPDVPAYDPVKDCSPRICR